MKPFEYLIVSDKTSKVILSSGNLEEVRHVAQLLTKAEAEFTVFRAISMKTLHGYAAAATAQKPHHEPVRFEPVEVDDGV